jgi:hypothetical protein
MYLGDGDDEVLFEKYNGRIPTLSYVQIVTGTFGGLQDDDEVKIEALHTRGLLSIHTRDGVDRVELSAAAAGDITIGDGPNAPWITGLNVFSGAAADEVTIKDHVRVGGDVNISTYAGGPNLFGPAEVDADVVYFDNNVLVEKDVTVDMGAGNDSLLITRDDGSAVSSGALETRGSLFAIMGVGNDKVYTRGLKAHGDVLVLSGTGADNVTLDNRVIQGPNGTRFTPEVYGNIDVQTYETHESRFEKDADQVRIYGANVRSGVFVRLGGGNDYFLFDEARFIGSQFIFDTGEGNDSAQISGVVVDRLMAFMGEGDDTLTLKSIQADYLHADGGGGLDSLTTTSARARLFDRLGWEYINGRRQIARTDFGLLS